MIVRRKLHFLDLDLFLCCETQRGRGLDWRPPSPCLVYIHASQTNVFTTPQFTNAECLFQEMCPKMPMNVNNLRGSI